MDRTADMNVQEKPDCGVVPVNQPNNEGPQPSAEAGEGRAQTERTSFNHTCVRPRTGNACPRDCPVCGSTTSCGHLSSVRAVCLNAPVRIYAGTVSDGCPYRDKYSVACVTL